MDYPVVIFDQVFQLTRQFERQFRDQGDQGLSTTQFQAMEILEQDEPLTAMVMAHRLHIAGPTATRALEALDRRRLIAKDRDPQDRRVIWLRLTDTGRFTLGQERDRQRRWMTQRLASLTESEAQMFLDLLKKLTAVSADSV